MTNTPEINITPPDEQYVMADCGCEIYDGQKMYEHVGDKKVSTMCAEHYLEQIKQDIEDITIDEVADLFQHHYEVVRF